MVSERIKLSVSCRTGLEFVNDQTKSGDAVVYIEGLIQMKTNYSNLVQNQFQGDKIMVKMLNAAFEHFVNENPRSAEFLSLYMDEKMRKGLAGMMDDEYVGVVGRRGE